MTTEAYQPFLMSKLARRMDVRFIGAVLGRFTLPGRQSEIGGAEVHACRLCSISPHSATVVAAVRAEPGEVVAAHFEHFGIIHAVATRQLPNGFGMDLKMSDEERANLAEEIKWQKRRAQSREPDKRLYPRIHPHDPCTVLTLADGLHMPCFVIDVSASGAAVSASILPVRGTPVAVGGLIGRVVRQLDVGFAVQFTEVQDPTRLERLIAPPPAAVAAKPPLVTA